MPIFYTCQTGGHIVNDVKGNPLVYPECNAKAKRNGAKYWNFCEKKCQKEL